MFDDHEGKKLMVLTIAPFLLLRAAAKTRGRDKPLDIEQSKSVLRELLPRMLTGGAIPPKPDDDPRIKFVKLFAPTLVAETVAVSVLYEKLRTGGLYVDLNGNRLCKPSDFSEAGFRAVRDYSQAVDEILGPTLA